MLKTKNLLKLIAKNLIISLIVISIVSVIVFYINQKITKITDSIALNHKLEAELKKRTEVISTIEKDSQTIGKNESLITDAFMPSDDISPFINKLDELVAISGITQVYHFDTPTPFAEEGPYPLSTITYSNNITADLQNFSIYLKAFENLPYFTKIDSLNISSQDKMGWTGLSNISIKATLITKATQ